MKTFIMFSSCFIFIQHVLRVCAVLNTTVLCTLLLLSIKKRGNAYFDSENTLHSFLNVIARGHHAIPCPQYLQWFRWQRLKL